MTNLQINFAWNWTSLLCYTLPSWYVYYTDGNMLLTALGRLVFMIWQSFIMNGAGRGRSNLGGNPMNSTW